MSEKQAVREIKKRLDVWLINRGSYLLGKKYSEELEKCLFGDKIPASINKVEEIIGEKSPTRDNTIKNIHIKHWAEPRSYIDDRLVYSCNWAVKVTPEKVAKKRKDVTCKNCLKKMNLKRW